MEKLFDRSAEYDAMLNAGLKFSGEDKHYFIKGRIDFLMSLLPQSKTFESVLDFGCGIGDNSVVLAKSFKNANVLGVDLSSDAIDFAQEKFGNRNGQLEFENLTDYQPLPKSDLCYVNGVFHHIPLANRNEALAIIHKSLKPDALLALFENNPLNPGTRFIMSRIPFDRDAILLTHWNTKSLLEANNFSVISTHFLFYFPNMLSNLRSLEKYFVKCPFGAQYLVLARKN
jgi:SAM-dependent methyltransferase